MHRSHDQAQRPPARRRDDVVVALFVLNSTCISSAANMFCEQCTISRLSAGYEHFKLGDTKHDREERYDDDEEARRAEEQPLVLCRVFDGNG